MMLPLIVETQHAQNMACRCHPFGTCTGVKDIHCKTMQKQYMAYILWQVPEKYYDTAVYTYSLKLNDVNAALLYRPDYGTVSWRVI